VLLNKPRSIFYRTIEQHLFDIDFFFCNNAKV